jgi:thiaminase
MNDLLMGIVGQLTVGSVVWYVTYCVMRNKLEKLDRERCPYGKSCMTYDVVKSKEALDRVVTMLEKKVEGYSENRLETLKMLHELRKL